MLACMHIIIHKRVTHTAQKYYIIILQTIVNIQMSSIGQERIKTGKQWVSLVFEIIKAATEVCNDQYVATVHAEIMITSQQKRLQ